MAITSIETKIKKDIDSKKLDSRIFYDKAGTTSIKAVPGTSTPSPARQRIGLSVPRNTVTVTTVTADSSLNGTKVGSITIFSAPTDYEVDSFRYGKDVKTVKNLLSDKISFNVTMGRENDITSDEFIDHVFEVNSYGQNSLFKTYDYEHDRFIPFEDFEGKPDPKVFLGLAHPHFSALKISGYPFVYSIRKNHDKFRNPDPASTDGAIEVFHVRNSPANTDFNDIKIKGARGLFGVGNWELTQHSTYGKKGSPLVSEKYEFEQAEHDFFEDAQETILGYSVEGFVSEGLYKIAPFSDTNLFDQQYLHVNKVAKESLIVSSSRDVSEIGTRFKSRENGFMITPFYKLTEQRCFGKDSIAFSGLLKG